MPSSDSKGRLIRKNGHIEVAKLPRKPTRNRSYWLTSNGTRGEYTHQLFRYPAKFHPPVVRWALGTFGRRGSLVVDPFTGSGTVQVEALIRGIDSIGVDVDPLACFVAKVKCTPIDPMRLQRATSLLRTILARSVAKHSRQEAMPAGDISSRQFEAERLDLAIPPIPNILHWFRRYVVIDLARILAAIDKADVEGPVGSFFRACLASIIRRVSNADPAPVSGLEVTSIQADRNKQRTIKVFDEFFAKVEREIRQMQSLIEAFGEGRKNKAAALILNGDIVKMKDRLAGLRLVGQGIPLVLTSPPYCRAVDYSRRHKLEFFWLGLVENVDLYSGLRHRYIGRDPVREVEHPILDRFGIRSLDRVVEQITEFDPGKGRSVHLYFHSILKSFTALMPLLNRRSTVVVVIGNSVCCGVPVNTAKYLAELLGDHFNLANTFRYAIRNHHMQYGLRNGDGIREEHVLVLKSR